MPTGVEEWAAGFRQGWPKIGWLSTLGFFYSRLLCDLSRYGPLCGVLFLICQTAPSTQLGHLKERVSRNRTITGEEGVPSRSNLLRWLFLRRYM